LSHTKIFCHFKNEKLLGIYSLKNRENTLGNFEKLSGNYSLKIGKIIREFSKILGNFIERPRDEKI
jgi:hypothetical protein